jgi:hypothetical protein
VNAAVWLAREAELRPGDQLAIGATTIHVEQSLDGMAPDVALQLAAALLGRRRGG